ncbi:MAG: ISC system 2Fe-2S type ferredoxin [Buchnera aphidicola (Chaetogeoica yunlongensis)]
MPKLIILPHEILLPKGGIFHATEGETILNIALNNNVNIEHACEKSCVCTTCHCYVHQGLSSLSICHEKEEDILDRAWNLKENSRLSCQAKIGNKDVKIEIPKYTINQ